MYYVIRKKVAGRTPYVILNYLQHSWRGLRGCYFVICDDWVYKFEPYKAVYKLRVQDLSKLVIKVVHSDLEEEILYSKVVEPGLFIENTYSLRASNVVGSEWFTIYLYPVSRIHMIPYESYAVEVKVLEYPARIVIRRAGAVRGRTVRRTTTLPSVRKITVLGVLGDYQDYTRELRSIFSEYTLDYGHERTKNIMLSKKGKTMVLWNGKNLVLKGDIDKILPLLYSYKDYFRTSYVFKQTSRIYGGLKI